MRLQLSNFVTDRDPIVVEVPGNPLLTENSLRAGAVDPLDEGDTLPIANYDEARGRWIVKGVPGVFTDIEVLP